MIKKGFLLASFAIGVFANIFAQDTLSFKKTRDKNIYVEFLGSSNLIGVSFDSRFTPISPWGYRLGVSYFQGGTINLTSNTTFGYYFFSNIGYRYISTKGFLFRIGLSPSFSFNDKHGVTKEPFIYPYISFGYSF